MVPTLLVFGAHSRITELDALSLSITQCAIAMKKTIDKIRKYTTFWQVNNAFNNYKRLSITFMYDLLIKLLVLIYGEIFFR